MNGEIGTDRRDDVVFITADGTRVFVSGPGGPDLRQLDDRSRAVLRALLKLSLARLDSAERHLASREQQ